jgi:hypothetical protein
VLSAEGQLEAHVLRPINVGRRLRLHPLVVGMSLAVGDVLYGMLGAVIAVPVCAAGDCSPLSERSTASHWRRTGRAVKIRDVVWQPVADEAFIPISG